MKRIAMQTIIIFFLVLSIFGCASKAGPFVTNISSDGRGGVIVEKCMILFDKFNATVENSDCTSTSFK